MATITRRRSSRDEETEEREERPTRRRRASDDMPDEERNSRPRRGRSSSREEEPEEDERPRRGRNRDSEDTEDRPRRSRRSGARGFGSFEQKRAKASDRADEFKPGFDNKVLIKFLEEEPFDSYNQHWIEPQDLPSGVKRRSYICTDDEYYDDKGWDGCPLCEIGESAKTYSLFNVLDLTNPRKPEVKVWTAPPGVSDKLERASREKKTSPLNREDLYWEVELIKKSNKSEWEIFPVKARDLQEDFDIEPFEADELDDFAQKLFPNREAVTKVDTYDDLAELADHLSDDS